jgi:hypothetical protein
MLDRTAPLVCECEAGNITRKNMGTAPSIFTRSGAVLELQMSDNGVNRDLARPIKQLACFLIFFK